jgi:hypothetical protein
MKKFITIVLALAICVALMVPAMAGAVNTQVTVTGSGNGPIIKCKWERIVSQTEGIADPCETPKPGTTVFDVFAVVTDPDGYGDLAGPDVNGQYGEIYADIYHPNVQEIANLSGNPVGSEWCGSWKYQLELWRMQAISPQEAVNLFNAALSQGLVTINEAWMADMGFDKSEAIADIRDELIETWAFIYTAQGIIHNHEQPDGPYTVVVMGYDRHGDPSDVPLMNTMVVPSIVSIYLDFKSVDYGQVTQSSWTAVGGDYTLCTPLKPTVWNNGNTPVMLQVSQDDMGFGYTGMQPPPTGEWNVEYAARLGDAMTGTKVEYEPYDTVTLPQVLVPCVPTKMDFWIHVIKANPAMNQNSGTWTGTLTVAPVKEGYPTCSGGG